MTDPTTTGIYPRIKATRHIAANASPDYVIRQLGADLDRLAEHEECAAAYTVSLGRLGCEEIARLVHVYKVEEAS